MMKQPRLTQEIKDRVEVIVTDINRRVIRDPQAGYVARYRGNVLYLDRLDGGIRSQCCRLTHTGAMDDWDFASYKYSDDRYDPEEWLFPGSRHSDGTVEGAMKAGLEAYP